MFRETTVGVTQTGAVGLDHSASFFHQVSIGGIMYHKVVLWAANKHRDEEEERHQCLVFVFLLASIAKQPHSPSVGGLVCSSSFSTKGLRV